MLSPDNKLFCRLDNMTTSGREQQRLNTLTDLGLLEAESVPIFEEATQTAAHFLDAPICILGLMDHERQWFKSAVGLSRIGLMNSLASSRQLPRHESFCTYVVESQQVLSVSDTTTHPVFVDRILVQRYGIRAYLGVPLMASNGFCVGTLAIMELSPREFTGKEVEFLELTARWCMSEYERNSLLKKQGTISESQANVTQEIVNKTSSSQPSNSVKTRLISQMTQELRTPLTSILGMASVLTREIYGPLTEKQKEYMAIIHNSGQYLLSLVNEVLDLGSLDDHTPDLNLSPVDIEMLCQQALSTLEQAAHRREQQIRLTVEPGSRIWLLDKDKVRQILYHLVFSVVQSSSADSVIRIHVSRKPNQLNLTIWTSHPWLGDGLPQAEVLAHQFAFPSLTSVISLENEGEGIGVGAGMLQPSPAHGATTLPEATEQSSKTLRQNLGLMLSRQLVELHGGSISLQGSQESGYRYVISLPQMTEIDEELT